MQELSAVHIAGWQFNQPQGEWSVEAIGSIRETAGGLDGDLKQRSEGAASSMEVHREKFFFQSLTGLPFAVKANKGAKAFAASASDDTVAVLEAVAAEIDDKADAPGTVLT